MAPKIIVGAFSQAGGGQHLTVPSLNGPIGIVLGDGRSLVVEGLEATHDAALCASADICQSTENPSVRGAMR